MDKRVWAGVDPGETSARFAFGKWTRFSEGQIEWKVIFEWANCLSHGYCDCRWRLHTLYVCICYIATHVCMMCKYFGMW